MPMIDTPNQSTNPSTKEKILQEMAPAIFRSPRKQRPAQGLPAKLSHDQREELFHWLAIENVSAKEAAQRLQQKFGISVKLGPIYRFWQVYCGKRILEASLHPPFAIPAIRLALNIGFEIGLNGTIKPLVTVDQISSANGPGTGFSPPSRPLTRSGPADANAMALRPNAMAPGGCSVPNAPEIAQPTGEAGPAASQAPLP
jgi:hypothetical protein